MKKAFCFLPLFLFLLILPYAALALTSAVTETTLLVREKVRLTVDNSEELSLVWYSSDRKIATVTTNGVVTGVKAGDAVIICAEKHSPDSVLTVTVHVVDRVTNMTFPSNRVTLLAGVECDASIIKNAVNIEPRTAYCQEVAYSTSDASIATVDADGTIHAIAPGRCTISALSL